MQRLHTLRYAIALAQEAEFKLNIYEGLNDYDPSVMHIMFYRYSQNHCKAIRGNAESESSNDSDLEEEPQFRMSPEKRL